MEFRFCPSARQQVKLIQNQFLEAEGLPFQDLLTESMVRELLPPGFRWTGRFYSPLSTLLVFLWQCLSAGSCQEAVARRVAQCAADGQKVCSSATGGYCVARARLPEGLVKGLARRVGHGLHKRAREAWLWTLSSAKIAWVG